MRLPGFEQKRIAALDRRRALAMPNDAVPGEHVIELPLRAMRVKGKRRIPRRQPLNLDIERMPLQQIRRLVLPPKRNGQALPKPPKRALGRAPNILTDIPSIDFTHRPQNQPTPREVSSLHRAARRGRDVAARGRCGVREARMARANGAPSDRRRTMRRRERPRAAMSRPRRAATTVPKRGPTEAADRTFRCRPSLHTPADAAYTAASLSRRPQGTQAARGSRR